MSEYSTLPPDLPVPEDDGAADHLVGMSMPRLSLPATSGDGDLGALAAALLVAYVYPRTGVPGVPSPSGWDDIPGARGCTPQSCSYRDSIAEFHRLGAEVVGVSAQSQAEQSEFVGREHIPFPLLSDAGLRLAEELRLPTFEVDGIVLYKRLTVIAESGRIAKVFYPVFPPDRDASAVLAWLQARDPAATPLSPQIRPAPPPPSRYVASDRRLLSLRRGKRGGRRETRRR